MFFIYSKVINEIPIPQAPTNVEILVTMERVVTQVLEKVKLLNFNLINLCIVALIYHITLFL